MRKRFLIKLSGEALMGSLPYGIDPVFISHVADELVAAWETGHQMALVIGGGNIFRGLSASARGIARPEADQMGMLATVMNAMALRSAIESSGSGLGVQAVVQSALALPQVAETFTLRSALSHLEARRIVIFAAGTGNPFFTTDSAAALRAAEIRADCMFKATKVDGVYDADPVQHPQATRFDRLTYDEVLERRLRVMDLTAITLCRENRIPVRVFSMVEKGRLLDVMQGREHGTLIGEDGA